MRPEITPGAIPKGKGRCRFGVWAQGIKKGMGDFPVAMLDFSET